MLVEKLAALAGTDVAVNAADPYGDGDQSLVTKGENSRQIFRELFSTGGDLGPNLVIVDDGFSPFARACGLGNAQAVIDMINATEEGSEERMQLLERRETGMRLTPLLITIALSKCKVFVCSVLPGVNEADMDHLRVIEILLRHGARPDCKELSGKSAVLYGAGSYATSDSLRMTDYIVDAAKSCAFFGKRVVLRNLNKKN